MEQIEEFVGSDRTDYSRKRKRTYPGRIRVRFI
jgi:hypothetical protein